MRRIPQSLVLVLILLSTLGLAQAANACYFACVPVPAPDDQFCERCEDVGYFTGGYCKNVGTCFCHDVLGVCYAPTAQAQNHATALNQALAAIFGTSAELVSRAVVSH